LNAEVISDAPITKYIAGILYPRSADPIEAEQDIDMADDDGESVVADPPVAMANVRYPSSAGLTFTVDRSRTKTIAVSARAARYIPMVADPHSPDPASETWQRQPVEMEPMGIDLTVDQPGKAEAVADGIDLYRRVRTVDADTVAVTVILVNTRRTQPGKPRDADSLFQVGVTITAPDPQSAVFVERPVPARDMADEDLRAYRLLYRTARSFAIGHGCSVAWAAEPHAERASKVETDFTPTYDLGLADSNPDIDAKALTLRFATNASRICGLDRAKAGRCRPAAH
jgi:hypothetical protein